MNIKKLLFLACMFLYIASTNNSSAGEITTTINQVGLATETFANIGTDLPISIEGHPCAVQTNFVSFDKTTEHGKQMLALAMAGYVSGKKLYIGYYDDQCGLWGNQALVYRIDLRN